MSDPIVLTTSAARSELAHRQSSTFRLTEFNKTYRIRLMPHFKIQNNEPIYHAIRDKFWNIPIPGSGGERPEVRTFTSPRGSGRSCYLSDLGEAIRATHAQAAKKLTPSPSYMFNVIDVDNPNFGIQQFTDNKTMYELILGVVDAIPTVADPEIGRIIAVTKMASSPWRTAIATDELSITELGFDLSAALPENLPNLDETWDYLEYDEQKEKFAGLAADPNLVLSGGQQQQQTQQNFQSSATKPTYGPPEQQAAPPMVSQTAEAQDLQAKLEAAAREGGG